MWTVTSSGLPGAPESPTMVTVKFSETDVEGRIVHYKHTLFDLPDKCSVVQLETIVQDLLGLSPRQPMELRYWGKPLDRAKLLSDYKIHDPEIKDHVATYVRQQLWGEEVRRVDACITVVVKPKLTAGKKVPGAELPLKRLRFASNKLQQPVAIEEGIKAEMTVLELKEKVQEQFKKTPVLLAQNNAAEDERTGTMAILKGDQLLLEQANVGGKKGIMKVVRVRDGSTGLVMEADAVELSLPVEEQVIFFEGLRMDDATTLKEYELVHNERLFLEFRWPWEEAGGDAGAAKPAKEGGKKKK